MSTSEASDVVRRVIGARMPYGPLYRNLAELHVARGDGNLQPGDIVTEKRRRMVHILSKIDPSIFLEKTWPEILQDQGLQPPQITERDRIEFRVLNALKTGVPDRLGIDTDLVRNVSHASVAAMRTAGSRNEQQYLEGGINVLEATLVTGITNDIGQRSGEILHPILSPQQSEQYGELIAESLAMVAVQLGCYDILFEE